MFGNKTLGFLGAGNMGQALIRGVLKSALTSPGQIIASQPTAEGLHRLHAELRVRTTTDNRALIEASDIVVIGVKPHLLIPVIRENAASFRADQTVVSVAAGVQVAAIEEALDAAVPVIRVMPNTPSLIGEGASGFCLGTYADGSHALEAARLLGATGLAFEVEEATMDAVTAISGSGPAYIFYIMEALFEGAAKVGLPPALADALVKQTVLGAAKLVQESEEGPAILRQRVISPGGTTEAALQVMDSRGVAQGLVDAIVAARDRSLVLAHSQGEG